MEPRGSFSAAAQRLERRGDFSRGPRMIVDVVPLLAAPTPLPDAGYRLVIQRQSEQLTGPVGTPNPIPG